MYDLWQLKLLFTRSDLTFSVAALPCGVVQVSGSAAIQDDGAPSGRYLAKALRVRGRDVRDRDCIRIKYKKGNKGSRYFVAIDRGGGQWDIAETPEVSTAQEIFERVQGIVGDVKKKVRGDNVDS